MAKKWLFQLAKTLQFLKKIRIMHRDLKLANIFLTEPTLNANIKLGDFGFSKAVENSLATSILGTPMYMAP